MVHITCDLCGKDVSPQNGLRYIVKMEPFASLPAEQVAKTIAPNLQRYLTGDLPDALAP